MSSIVPLFRCIDPRAGGKATRLSKLASLGLRVPEGFVVIGATPSALPADIDEAQASLGGRVAVRSSAQDEDTEGTSFAGQYDTLLNVEGASAVRAAIERCLASARSARADAYREAMHAPRGVPMSVIVQRMVDARVSGVLFTRDPVRGVHDQIVIEATMGLGDALMSGRVAPHRIVVSREGAVLANDPQGSAPAIDLALAARLVREALVAETHFGYALDTEWAVDHEDIVFWLQARPITTTNGPDIHELDTRFDRIEERLFTTYNVSEVLPGAVTPLSYRFIIDSTNVAMRDIMIGYGVPEALLVGEPVVAQFSGHMFMNMKALYVLSRYVLGASKQSVDHSLAGMDLEDVEVGPLQPLPRRALNTMRYFRSLLHVRRKLEEFVQRGLSYDIVRSPNAKQAYQNIQNALPLMYEAAAVHCHTSALSTALNGILMVLLTHGQPATAEHQATVSRLLAHVDPTHPDVAQSSLGLSRAIDRLTAAIAASPADAARFATFSADEALAWVRDAGDATMRRAFEDLLRDHGHRCAREGELREPDWREDPRPLIRSVQGILALSGAGFPLRPREADAKLPAMPLAKGWVVERIVAMTREAVVMRERSKSHAIRAMRAFRPAYVALAALLVESNSLPDTDVIFFFTHEELGRFVETGDPSLVRRALRRRRLHPWMMAFEFPRSSVGKPVPIEEDQGAEGLTDAMRGTPVSRGVVVGLARVARTVAEAELIEPDEILVVPSTDIGWAPYFLRAAGLASEIGGTISHGAVVARESGVPMIVNLPGATARFRTGDKLRLDGNTGELRRLERTE